MKKSLTLALLTAAVATTQAVPVVVTWGLSGPVGSNTGFATDFDNAEMNLAGGAFSANALLDIGGPGIHHSHGGSTVPWQIDVMVDGSWVNLFSEVESIGGTTSLASLSTPVSFPGGIVSRIRLISTIPQNQSFHNMLNTTFTFDSVATPEASSTLMLLGSAFAAVAFLRRK